MIKALAQVSPEMNALARYMAAARRRNLPPRVIEKAKHHVLDTLASMVSGSRLLPGRRALAYVAALGGRKESLVAGSSIVTNAVNAALANGMMAHADETDDTHVSSHTHPGCAVVPAALAIAERAGTDGKAFLRAVVLGYDVGCRLTKALDVDALTAAYRSPHSFGGAFGAGAAAGSLLGLNATQVRHLLSYCAQMASGCTSNVRDSEHIEKAFDFAGMPAHAEPPLCEPGILESSADQSIFGPAEMAVGTLRDRETGAKRHRRNLCSNRGFPDWYLAGSGSDDESSFCAVVARFPMAAACLSRRRARRRKLSARASARLPRRRAGRSRATAAGESTLSEKRSGHRSRRSDLSV